MFSWLQLPPNEASLFTPQLQTSSFSAPFSCFELAVSGARVLRLDWVSGFGSRESGFGFRIWLVQTMFSWLQLPPDEASFFRLGLTRTGCE